MEFFWTNIGSFFLVVLTFEFSLAFLLTGLPTLGSVGKNLSTSLCQAPGLDGVLSLMIWVPWLICSITGGWLGFIGCLAGQILAMQLWIAIHEVIYAQYRQGPRINAYLNQRFGWWQNQLALWVTAVVVPVFFLIRFAEIFVYPWLTWLLGFKTYNHSEWVNVSRHKFEGLVGTDLIWCLYCDWMTGVYALGAEMLRNVESFWCPIRFHYDKKCENCSVDFPDIDGGWIAANGSMAEVVDTLKEKSQRSVWSWFGASSSTPEQQRPSQDENSGN